MTLARMTQGPNYEQSDLAYGRDLQTISMDTYTQLPSNLG
jgi:hypothetical protein